MDGNAFADAIKGAIFIAVLIGIAIGLSIWGLVELVSWLIENVEVRALPDGPLDLLKHANEYTERGSQSRMAMAWITTLLSPSSLAAQ